MGALYAATKNDGVVYEDDNVKVEAFRVRHGQQGQIHPLPPIQRKEPSGEIRDGSFLWHKYSELRDKSVRRCPDSVSGRREACTFRKTH